MGGGGGGVQRNHIAHQTSENPHMDLSSQGMFFLEKKMHFLFVSACIRTCMFAHEDAHSVTKLHSAGPSS